MGKFSGIFKSLKSGAKKVGRGAKRAGKRFAKDFVRRLAKGFNLEDVYDEQMSIRDYKRSLAFGGLKKQTNVVDEPPLDTPKTETNISNPSISAINDQLKKILKTAKAIGLVDKKTQELAMQQLRESNRIAKETQLETPPDAVPVPTAGSGSDISPLADSMQSLISAFQDLIKTVQAKSNEQGGSGSGIDFGSRRRRGKPGGPGKPPKTPKAGGAAATTANATKASPARAPVAETTKTGAIRYRDAAGRFAKAPEAAAKQPGMLSRFAGRAKETATVAGRDFGSRFAKAAPLTAAVATKTASVTSSAAKTATGGVVKGIKAGALATKGAAAKGAQLTGEALKSVIIKVAGPKLGKAVAQTGIKSIPILGAIASVGFAASRLAKGDYLGAGLDAVSGLAGPMTAIPAMVLSLSRDIYSEVFGVQPEADPEFTNRMPVVTKTVEELVTKQISKKVQPKDQMASAAPQKEVPVPQAVKQTGAAPASQAPPNPPPQPAPTDAAKPIDESSGSSGSSSPSASSSLPPAPAPKPQPGSSSNSGSTTAPPANSSESGSNAAPTPQVAQGPATAITLPPATTTGSQISAATEAAENAGAPRPRIGSATVAAKPATKPTTKTGARGMGNVPEPTYMSMGSIARQLYFSASI